MKLLSRDEFRNGVFERDGHKCVMCRAQGQDAHHIIERRLWSDGGYYLENGATLCGDCHIKAETTQISCEDIRTKAGIKDIMLPSHLYRDNRYDKWGNIILINGLRLKGELFFDESVQKILTQGDVLGLFSSYVKYPRTYHLPWSEGMSDDDRMHSDLSFFAGKEVIVTEKMDGENTTIYSNYIHARSVDGESHWTQSHVRKFAATIGYNIPNGWRICLENLYATHSIKYENLSTYFMVFSIWNEKNQCLSWNETIEWSELLNLTLVPVLYRGIWDEKIIKNLWNPKAGKEGYVVRLADRFDYGQFKLAVGKFVRKNHVTTNHHWKFSNIELNKLK